MARKKKETGEIKIMALMQIKNLTMKFSGITAIEDLSFDVEEGSITSLIGPNGAGKTSAFNCMTGFYKATSGDILFENKSLLNFKPYKITQRGIIRTFQNVRLFKNLTVLENVMSGTHRVSGQSIFGALLRCPSQRREEREILKSSEFFLDYVGILDKKNESAKNLSYGDQRRTEWARALAAKPKLLLFDEPAAGLNREEKERLVGLIGNIRKDFGVTVFLIEHDMDLVMKVSEKVIVINFGTKIAEGTPSEIQSNQSVIEAYLGMEEDGEV
ncbi:MAG: ABC transporter ATP-binding protein [Oscillospiraceae bacterium]|nr:ABC transporter ATP-binding protein [Oscillospiraceae bacterium]